MLTKSTIGISYLGAVAVFVIATAGIAVAAKPPAAKVSSKQAEAAALKRIKGHVVSSSYEFEDGHWQYAVVISKKSKLYEVEVSANTGKVTDIETTSPGEEAAESAADAKSHKM